MQHLLLLTNELRMHALQHAGKVAQALQPLPIDPWRTVPIRFDANRQKHEAGRVSNSIKLLLQPLREFCRWIQRQLASLVALRSQMLHATKALAHWS